MSVAEQQKHNSNPIKNTTSHPRDSLFAVTNLTIQLKQRNQAAPLVNNVSFTIEAGESLALIGESGSGKTLTSLALLGLLPKTLQQTNGEIKLNGKILSQRGNHRFAQVRGAEIAMIFQEPLAALNPVFPVGHQIKDVVKTHRKVSSGLAKEKIITLFEQVGLREAKRVYKAYPHELSGGMAQRVMIAMALSCGPQLLIADEPTTALDVLTQNKILSLISDLQNEYNFALLLVSHDNKVVEKMTDSTIYMHAGQLIPTNPSANVTAISL